MDNALATVAAVLAAPPDGYPLTWRDVTTEMVGLGFPLAPGSSSRYLDIVHFNAHDERRYAVVHVDEDYNVTTCVGTEHDSATAILLAYDLRAFDTGGRCIHRADLTVSQERARDEQIARLARPNLTGEAA